MAVKKENEKLESWINLAYAIDMGEAKPEDYPKDFQEWYANRKGMKKRKNLPDEIVKKTVRK